MSNEQVRKNAVIEKIKTAAASLKFTILYLDDEEALFDTIEHEASEYGMQAYCKSSYREALQFIEERRSELALIVSDLRMPEVDGFEFRKKVLEIDASIPFMVLSAFIDKDIALMGVELKINSFLEKPLNEVQFATLMEREVLPRINNIKDDREMQQGFVADAEALIEELEEILIALESNYDDIESLNRFFGIIHTIKGASSFFEPNTLHKYTHRYEDILKLLQRGELKFSTEILKMLFAGFDVIKLLIAEFAACRFAKHDLDMLLEGLNYKKISQQKNQTEQLDKVVEDKSQVAKSQDVKVSSAMLDHFMYLSGEVTVIRNMINKCVRSIEKKYLGDSDVAGLSEMLSELHKLNGSMQDSITELRKMPLKSVLKHCRERFAT